MTTAQSIIESGFARSTASDAGKLAVDGELITHLDRNYQSYYALMAVAQPDNCLTSSTLTFAGSPVQAALPADIIDIVRLEQTDTSRAHLVKAADKDRSYHLKPAVYRKGNALISVGRSGDPIVSTQLVLFYLDAPAAITGLSSTLDSRYPKRFENLLVLDIAIYLSIKDENRKPERIAALKGELGDALKVFYALTGASNTASGKSGASSMAIADTASP